MKIFVIKTRKQHREYLKELERLLCSGNNSKDSKWVELLSVIIEKYESECFPIDKPTPVEAVKFRMEQQGLKRSDLAQYMGSKSRISEFFSGKRRLSLNVIKALHKGLDIPASVLIQ